MCVQRALSAATEIPVKEEVVTAVEEELDTAGLVQAARIQVSPTPHTGCSRLRATEVPVQRCSGVWDSEKISSVTVQSVRHKGFN